MSGPTNFENLMVESVADGMVGVSFDGPILYANRSFLDRSGHRLGDIVGKPCRDAVRGSLCETGCPLPEVIESGRPAGKFDVDIVEKGGGGRSGRTNFTPLRDDGGKVK